VAVYTNVGERLTARLPSLLDLRILYLSLLAAIFTSRRAPRTPLRYAVSGPSPRGPNPALQTDAPTSFCPRRHASSTSRNERRFTVPNPGGTSRLSLLRGRPHSPFFFPRRSKSALNDSREQKGYIIRGGHLPDTIGSFGMKHLGMI